jgi:hypothetical protein
LTQINVADTLFGQKSIMRRITRVDLDELADLREKAARVCEEAKSLIEEHRGLRKWAGRFSAGATPLIETFPPLLPISNVEQCQLAAPRPSLLGASGRTPGQHEPIIADAILNKRDYRSGMG